MSETQRGEYHEHTNTDDFFLRESLIPPYRRVYSEGREIWPGDGKVPEGWDGVWPDNSMQVKSQRSHRSRKR